MEKRTLLAVILSLFVLYVYSALMPKKAIPTFSDSQIIENKEDISFYGDVQEAVSTTPLPLQPSVVEPQNEKMFELNSEHLNVGFSNIGGVLESATVSQFNQTLPITNLMAISGYENVPFLMERINESSIIFKYTDAQFEIRKEYLLREAGRTIFSRISVRNVSGQNKIVNLNFDGLLVDLSRLDNSDQRYRMLLEYSINDGSQVYRHKNGSKFSSKENKVILGDLEWVGFRDQYFCGLVSPDFEVEEYSVKVVGEEMVKLGMKPKAAQIDAGDEVVFDSVIYYGPQDLSVLKGYEGRQFDSIVSFKVGGFFDIMAFGQTDTIAKFMLNVLNFLHKIIPNWGVSIILFAFLIYGVTYPLTLKSLSSMKKMQVLQPEIAKIREKHKNNPQKMQQEMMAFYKEHKFNPFSGCFPMLIQMPLFVSLYQLLWRSFTFKGASFLWIKDLSEPDRLITLPTNLPFMGNEINVLPIIYGFLMFMQQRFSSKNMVAADSAQADMQKMMSKILPIMLTVIFYKFASGLTLYFTVYFMLTTISQWKISKSTKAA